MCTPDLAAIDAGAGGAVAMDGNPKVGGQAPPVDGIGSKRVSAFSPKEKIT